MKQKQSSTPKVPTLTSASTAEEKLSVIEHYIPTTVNLPENLAVLHHLKLEEKDISAILCGGYDYVYGEISSRKHPSSCVHCSGVKVNIHDGEVCLGDVSFEDYIKAEKKRQESIVKDVDEHSKEELVDEIKRLRKEAKTLTDRLNDSQTYIQLLKDRNEMLKERCK